jgi:HEAT repeat protein
MGRLEEIKLAKEIIQALLKAKKAVRMYPENNPIYARTVDDVLLKFQDFFTSRSDLHLRIKQNELFLDTEQIYHNPDKEDNLALFFFKDGLRELIFDKDLAKNELDEFLKIIALDFDREAVEDDIVTLLWEKDFHAIKYVVDEAFLLEDDTYESRAVSEVKSLAPQNDELLKAYADAFTADDVKDISIVNLSDKDLQTLVREIEKDLEEKTGKLSEILFEMLFHTESSIEYNDIYHFLTDVIFYSLRHGDLKTVVEIMKKADEIAASPASSENSKHQMRLLTKTLSSDESIKYLGEILESEEALDDTLIHEYVSFLEKDAIPPFISTLGQLKSIHGRKQVINILIGIGKKDLPALAKGLHDSRWYVVRNIIYILRHIGDKKAVEYLLSTARHSDVRVRKESIKALGELKSPLALQILRDCLDDIDTSIRRTSAKSLSSIGSETAKQLLMRKISEKDFKKKDLEEKKEFYEALSRWNDDAMADFVLKTLRKKSIFNKASVDENRACAAYCLGIMERTEALSALSKLKDTKNRLLREYVNAALKRIKHGS